MLVNTGPGYFGTIPALVFSLVSTFVMATIVETVNGVHWKCLRICESEISAIRIWRTMEHIGKAISPAEDLCHLDFSAVWRKIKAWLLWPLSHQSLVKQQYGPGEVFINVSYSCQNSHGLGTARPKQSATSLSYDTSGAPCLKVSYIS